MILNLLFRSISAHPTWIVGFCTPRHSPSDLSCKKSWSSHEHECLTCHTTGHFGPKICSTKQYLCNFNCHAHQGGWHGNHVHNSLEEAYTTCMCGRHCPWCSASVVRPLQPTMILRTDSLTRHDVIGHKNSSNENFSSFNDYPLLHSIVDCCMLCCQEWGPMVAVWWRQLP